MYAIVPLAIYFFSMFIGSFYASYALGASYAQSVTLAFTAASNNFELALAVAVSTFGLHSDEALMSVVGALIEIPTMLGLITVAFYFKAKLAWKEVSEFSRGKGTSPTKTYSLPLSFQRRELLLMGVGVGFHGI